MFDGNAKTTAIVSGFSPDTGLTFSDMTISEQWISGLLSESICFAADFPVPIFPMQEPGRESTENGADSGPSTPGLFARFDPGTFLLRTSQRCLDGGWSVFSATLPPAGTMRNGKLSELPTSAPGTSASEYGFLPTPCASEYRDRSLPVVLAKCDKGGRVARRLCSIGLRLGMPLPSVPVRIAPWFLEMAMGYPIGHTALNPSATALCPPLPNGLETES